MTRFLLSLLVCGTCFAPVLVQPYRFSSSGLTLPAITSGTYLLQLVADDLTAGSTVSAWTSRVGSYSADQATVSKRPAVVASAIGGKNGVTFDSVDDAITVPSFAAGGLSAITVFIVHNVPTSAAVMILMEASVDVATKSDAFICYVGQTANRTLLYAVAGGQGNGANTSIASTGADFVFSGTLDKSLAGASEATVYLDGTNRTSTLISNDLGGTFGTNDLYIGSRAGNSIYLSGTIAAIVVCSGALNTTDRQAIENALMGYY